MNTINRKKSLIAAVGSAVAAAAVPAFLFAGAGTAQAFTNVTATPNASGVTVHIKSYGIGLKYPSGSSQEAFNASISSGACTYTAIPKGLGVPVYNQPFSLAPGGTAVLTFSGIQTGTTWDVTVKCNNGTNSGTQQVVY